MPLIQIDRQGVKQAVDEINALKQVKSCVTAGSALLPFFDALVSETFNN